MRWIGNALALFGIIFFRREWKQLEVELQKLNRELQTSPAPCIPSVLIQALLIAEDHRFFLHYGVDPIAIARALWRLLCHGRIEGASTIEQQLVRTITRRYERTIRRKVREVLLASIVSRSVPKNDIAKFYLSIAYYGWYMNGLGQVCSRLRVSLGEITMEEAAAIIARIKYPEPRIPLACRAVQIENRKRHIIRLLMSECSVMSNSDSSKESIDATIYGLRRIQTSKKYLSPARASR